MEPKSMLNAVITDALRYWERLRLAYNGILTCIVIGFFGAAVWSGQPIRYFTALVALFMLAVAANVAYSTAYLVDIFVQLSDFRDLWRRWRWMLFVIGMAFAVILAAGVSQALFFHPLQCK